MATFVILKDIYNHNNELHFHSGEQSDRDQEWEMLKKKKGQSLELINSDRKPSPLILLILGI